MGLCSDSIEKILREKLSQEEREIPVNIDPRVPAAVLIPFVCVNDEWNLLFTKRTNDVGKHQGEISFPGGTVEKHDRNLIDTALRETCEEIGISKTKIKVLGTIDPVPTVSNYCVLPVIGIIEWPVNVILNQCEVEKIILIPIDWLRNDENWYQQEYLFAEGKSRTLIHYNDYFGDHLWGLTAMLAQKALQLI